MARKYAIYRAENNVDFPVYITQGIYDIPVIKPERYEETMFIPFSNANATRNKGNVGIHFFIDDYRFQRLWSARDKYANMLSQFKAVMSPDYSMYTDYPFVIQLFNHYRKHLIGQWMQSIGIKVYPTICWSDEKSFSWCFDGEPHHATVCVGSVGTQKSKETKKLFLTGYDKMLDILEPETILFYGVVPKECKGNIVTINTFKKELKERLGEK